MFLPGARRSLVVKPLNRLLRSFEGLFDRGLKMASCDLSARLLDGFAGGVKPEQVGIVW